MHEAPRVRVLRSGVERVAARGGEQVEHGPFGIDAVEQGVKRSRIAGESLERIRESARDASMRVSEINRAADEQAHEPALASRALSRLRMFGRRRSCAVISLIAAIAQTSVSGLRITQARGRPMTSPIIRPSSA